MNCTVRHTALDEIVIDARRRSTCERTSPQCPGPRQRVAPASALDTRPDARRYEQLHAPPPNRRQPPPRTSGDKTVGEGVPPGRISRLDTAHTTMHTTHRSVRGTTVDTYLRLGRHRSSRPTVSVTNSTCIGFGKVNVRCSRALYSR